MKENMNNYIKIYETDLFHIGNVYGTIGLGIYIKLNFILYKNGWTKIDRIIHKDLMDYEKDIILNIIENSGHFIVNEENKTFYSSKIKQQTLEHKYIESDYNRSIDNGKSIDILKK